MAPRATTPRARSDRAGLLAGGTGQRIGELLGLAPGQLFERATCQPARDRSGDVLHLVEVHIEVGTVWPVSSVGDDFAHCWARSFTAASCSDESLRLGIDRPALHLGRTSGVICLPMM